MIPIPPELLESCVFIYRSRDDAQNRFLSGGTGFVVGIVLERNTEFRQLYIVTCEHVIRHVPNPTVRINHRSLAPPPVSSECFETNGARWICHPEGDDLAVFPIELEQAEYAFCPVFVDRFIVPNDPRIWSGDETFMVGRFIGKDGKDTNTPVVRFGNLSLIPEVAPVGEAQEPFLVEQRSLPGYSGSPVFVVLDPHLPRPPLWLTPFGAAYRPDRHGPWLLGIDSGHVHNYEKVLRANKETPVDPEQFVKGNTGLANVIPIWRLQSLLNCEELKEQRTKEDSRITNEKAAL